MEKKTSGRRKLEMKAIGDESKRHVAFSKRKSGIFNKAAELNVLTGAEVVVIVFSKYGKAYTFATPGSESLLSSWIGDHTGARNPSQAAEAQCTAAKRELRRLEDSARRLAEQRNSCGAEGGFWWDQTVAIGAESEEMEAFREALLELRRKVAERATALAAARGETTAKVTSFLPMLDGDGGDGDRIMDRRIGGYGDLVNGLITGSPSSEVYN